MPIRSAPGISAAYHLSQAMTDKKLERPLKAVVLEARDFCEFGCDEFSVYLVSNR